MTEAQPALPRASQSAINHPPTGRAIRRRLRRQALFLLVGWPTLVLAPGIRAASGDDRFIPLTVIVVLVFLPTCLPLSVVGIVTTLRIKRRLTAHSWRLVDCEVVPPGPHAWPVRAYDASPGRETRVQALLRIHGTVLRSAPFKRYVSTRLTQVWCAGPPEPGAVVSEPGGARPFRLALYKSAAVSAESVPRR